MQIKNDGSIDRRSLREVVKPADNQLLPTKHGLVQMVFRENKIVNGCVSTKIIEQQKTGDEIKVKKVEVTVFINEEEEAALQKSVEFTNTTLKKLGYVPNWTIEKELHYACRECIDNLKRQEGQQQIKK